MKDTLSNSFTITATGPDYDNKQSVPVRVHVYNLSLDGSASYHVEVVGGVIEKQMSDLRHLWAALDLELRRRNQLSRAFLEATK